MTAINVIALALLCWVTALVGAFVSERTGLPALVAYPLVFAILATFPIALGRVADRIRRAKRRRERVLRRSQAQNHEG
ncbi:MAG: hypothetical protein U0572_11305 [Phycisphaerales bacterium]